MLLGTLDMSLPRLWSLLSPLASLFDCLSSTFALGRFSLRSPIVPLLSRPARFPLHLSCLLSPPSSLRNTDLSDQIRSDGIRSIKQLGARIEDQIKSIGSEQLAIGLPEASQPPPFSHTIVNATHNAMWPWSGRAEPSDIDLSIALETYKSDKYIVKPVSLCPKWSETSHGTHMLLQIVCVNE